MSFPSASSQQGPCWALQVRELSRDEGLGSSAALQLTVRKPWAWGQWENFQWSPSLAGDPQACEVCPCPSIGCPLWESWWQPKGAVCSVEVGEGQAISRKESTQNQFLLLHPHSTGPFCDPDVWGFPPHATQAVSSAGCLLTQFSVDTVYLERAADPTG